MSHNKARFPKYLLGLTVALTLTGCEGSLSILAPAGPAARYIAHLWWGMLLGSGVLTLFVMGLVALCFRRSVRPPLGVRFWALGLGVAMPLAVLVVLVGTGLWMGERMQANPLTGVVQVEAIGRQWAWRFVQPGSDGKRVMTENVLFIPASTPVDVSVSSEDVIHSFWIPRFAGKMDAIPGHRNVLRIQADMPGRYEGQSAEFSGAGYGGMRFAVVVYPPGEVPVELRNQAMSASTNATVHYSHFEEGHP